MNATPESLERVRRNTITSAKTIRTAVRSLWYSITVSVPGEAPKESNPKKSLSQEAASWLNEMEDFDRF